MRGYLRESMLGGGVAVVTAVGLCLLGASPWGAHPAVLSIPVFAAMLLIIICGNVALLLFARAATRENEKSWV